MQNCTMPWCRLLKQSGEPFWAVPLPPGARPNLVGTQALDAAPGWGAHSAVLVTSSEGHSNILIRVVDRLKSGFTSHHLAPLGGALGAKPGWGALSILVMSVLTVSLRKRASCSRWG